MKRLILLGVAMVIVSLSVFDASIGKGVKSDLSGVRSSVVLEESRNRVVTTTTTTTVTTTKTTTTRGPVVIVTPDK